MPDELRSLNSLDEVAAFLGKPRNTIRDWVSKGLLASRKVGRSRMVSRAEVLRFVGASSLRELQEPDAA